MDDNKTGAGNLFAGLASLPADDEHFQEILARPNLRIERIVSQGQSSPPGFWYEQAQAEWVLLVSGEARLRFEDEDAARRLRPGDHLLIAPRRRHRVDATAAGVPTVWLAVWFDES
ncbi:cupin domain-containing protein [Ancylobacter sp. G4_0304]|uniref:cupin domain-containing protein n=1 Tax=Ancylobacter sp. G4_0304 TaxID=3114289 RepID=UPI0039C7044B